MVSAADVGDMVRHWKPRANGAGTYATIGRLVSVDGDVAVVAVRSAGRHLVQIPELNVPVPSSSVELLSANSR